MNARYYSSLVLISLLGIFMLSSSTFVDNPPKDDKFVIIIDPGHGGRDTGTPGTGRYKASEKDIALDVSLALGKMLTTQLNNVEVIYTRKNDIFPTLQDRAKKANKKSADLFISIHCNAQPLKNRRKGGPAYGSETFVLGLHKSASNLEVAKRENSVIFLEDNYEETYEGFDPNSPESLIGLTLMQEEYLEQSIEIASYIEKEFISTAKRKSRGVKQAGFWVLSKTYMPSVLVELGFLTNIKEENFLNSKKGKDLMTKSLFNAVKKYISARVDVERDIDFTRLDDDANIKKDIVFKVQLAASSKNLALKPYNFKGLRDLSKKKYGKLYKYFTGETNNYDKAKEIQQQAIKKGYGSSFIVAYKNGEKISLNEALK